MNRILPQVKRRRNSEMERETKRRIKRITFCDSGTTESGYMFCILRMDRGRMNEVYTAEIQWCLLCD